MSTIVSPAMWAVHHRAILTRRAQFASKAPRSAPAPASRPPSAEELALSSMGEVDVSEMEVGAREGSKSPIPDDEESDPNWRPEDEGLPPHVETTPDSSSESFIDDTTSQKKLMSSWLQECARVGLGTQMGDLVEQAPQFTDAPLERSASSSTSSSSSSSSKSPRVTTIMPDSEAFQPETPGARKVCAYLIDYD